MLSEHSDPGLIYSQVSQMRRDPGHPADSRNGNGYGRVGFFTEEVVVKGLFL